MADELNNTDSAPPPQADVAGQPAAAPAPLTAEQVKAMIDEATQKAFNSGAAAARRELQGKQPKPPETKPPEAAKHEAGTAQDAHAVLALRDAFDEAIDGKSLSLAQKKLIREQVMAGRIEDVPATVQKYLDAFGSTTSNANNATPGQPPNSQPPPAKGPALPAPAPTADRELDTIFRSMPEDAARDTWQAYVRRTGANPANPYDPRNRAAWREMRKRFEAQVATASIQLGARR